MYIVYPDYKNSIVNLVSSVLATYNVKTDHSPLTLIDLEELKQKKNVVLFVIDGFGLNLLKRYATDLKFLNKNLVSSITSVCPSTTSAAITSLISGKTPWEHGVIGWTLFFKEFAKYLDFLPIRDSINGELLDAEHYDLSEIFKTRNIFQKISEKSPEVQQYFMTHEELSTSTNTMKNAKPAEIIPYPDHQELFRKIKNLLLTESSRKFIFIYTSSPDKIEHQTGVYTDKVLDFIREIDSGISKLSQKAAGSDTAILITADHGLTDIKKYYYVNEHKQLMDSLIMPTSPEPRFISFFVKKHKFAQFEKAFKKYKENFILFDREKFIKSKLLGTGKVHPKLDDFLGDFIAVAISDQALKSIYRQNGKWKKEFLAHHAGLTADEMLVPLIEINL
ncbi:MAG: alkaline phosphatase family protein [Candidatus Cloacimonetes bacterium]|nr:alkaline phosphatase family protein [Candidatus Cloacimonadota bacterium]